MVIQFSVSWTFFAGCVGGICGLANILGQECCDLEELFRQGKMEEAKVLQHRLIGPNIGVGFYGYIHL